VSCAKTVGPVEMPFCFSIQVDPRKHVLGGVLNWRMPLNRPCAAAMRPICQISLTTCRLLSAESLSSSLSLFMSYGIHGVCHLQKCSAAGCIIMVLYWSSASSY